MVKTCPTGSWPFKLRNMRTFYKRYNWALLFCLILLTACTKEDAVDLETRISEAQPSFPADNVTVDLNVLKTGETVIFEWEPAKAEDNTVVFYEVVFDTATGDFSSPLYKAIPGKLGSETRISISHTALNEVVKKLGVPELSTVDLKWKVISTNGVSVTTSTNAPTVKLRRSLDTPNALYVYGSGTEAGTDITKAVQFRKITPSTYEAYLSLQPGSYALTETNVAGSEIFSFSGSRLVNTEGSLSVITPGVYRINIDMASGVSLTEIQSVGLWIAANNNVSTTLSYAGNGIWKATNIPITWVNMGSWRDERYKFRVTEKDAAGQTSTKFLGSANKDNPNRPTSGTAATYYYLKPVDNSQWDYTYKFGSESQRTDIELKLQATGDYTHSVVYK